MSKHLLIRQRLAQEAARIMADQGHVDYRTACRKAAARMGIDDLRQHPKNSEIDQALREYQQLFHSERQSNALRMLRSLAMEAMQALEHFQPRLVGPVLEGSADQYSNIILHLFAEAPEEVVLALSEMNIPWRDGEVKLRYSDGKHRRYPTFSFHAGDSRVELVVFPLLGLRNAPLSHLNEQPERRASFAQVRELAASDRSGPTTEDGG